MVGVGLEDEKVDNKGRQLNGPFSIATRLHEPRVPPARMHSSAASSSCPHTHLLYCLTALEGRRHHNEDDGGVRSGRRASDGGSSSKRESGWRGVVYNQDRSQHNHDVNEEGNDGGRHGLATQGSWRLVEIWGGEWPCKVLAADRDLGWRRWRARRFFQGEDVIGRRGHGTCDRGK